MLLTRRESVGCSAGSTCEALRRQTAEVIERFRVKSGGPAAVARSLSGGNLQKYIVGREIDAAPKVLVVGAADLGRGRRARPRRSTASWPGSATPAAPCWWSRRSSTSSSSCATGSTSSRAGGSRPPSPTSAATVELIGEWMSGLWPGAGGPGPAPPMEVHVIRLEARPAPSTAWSLRGAGGGPGHHHRRSGRCSSRRWARTRSSRSRSSSSSRSTACAASPRWRSRPRPLVFCSLGLALCLPLQRLEHRRRGAVPHGRHRRRRAGALGHQRRHRDVALGLLPAAHAGRRAGRGGLGRGGGLLRDRFNANEILVSLMLVYVANLFLTWLVFGPWKDPDGFNFPQTVNFAATTEVPRLVRGMRLNAGSPVALLAALLTWLFLFRTYAGVQLQVGGPAPAAARYAGFSLAGRHLDHAARLRRAGRGGRRHRGGRAHGPAHARTSPPATASPPSSWPTWAGSTRSAASWGAWCSPPSSSAASWPSRGSGSPRR